MTSHALLPITAITCCAPLIREPLTADQADGLARSMKALADSAHLRLISIVAASDGAEVCVCDLIEPLEGLEPISAP